MGKRGTDYLPASALAFDGSPIGNSDIENARASRSTGVLASWTSGLEPGAESGPESLVRLMLRTIGVAFDVQRQLDGVARVDFLVDGWLIVECDSQAHHSSWEAQRRDRRRDQIAATQGFATYRPIAEDIMWQPDEVRAALRGLLGARRRAENSSSRSRTQAKAS